MVAWESFYCIHIELFNNCMTWKQKWIIVRIHTKNIVLFYILVACTLSKFDEEINFNCGWGNIQAHIQSKEMCPKNKAEPHLAINPHFLSYNWGSLGHIAYSLSPVVYLHFILHIQSIKYTWAALDNIPPLFLQHFKCSSSNNYVHMGNKNLMYNCTDNNNSL